MPKFKHQLGDKVKLKMSAEHGEVVGIAFYVASETNYLIRYMAGDGRQTESYWGENAIEAFST